MDQLKYIKIQNADSSWSDKIPVSPDPSQIIFIDNENLQDKIENIENFLDVNDSSSGINLIKDDISKISIQAWGYAAKAQGNSYNTFITTPNQTSSNFLLQDGVIIALSFHNGKAEGTTISLNLYVNRTRKYDNIPVLAPTYAAGETEDIYFTSNIPGFLKGDVITFIYDASNQSFIYLGNDSPFLKEQYHRQLLDDISQDSIYLMDRDAHLPLDDDGNQTGIELNWPDEDIRFFIIETRLPSHTSTGTRIQRAWTTRGILYSRTRYIVSGTTGTWSTWKRELTKDEFDTLKTDYQTFKDTTVSTLISNAISQAESSANPSSISVREYTSQATGQSAGYTATSRKAGNIVTISISGNLHDEIEYNNGSSSENPGRLLLQLPEEYCPSTERNFITFLTAQHYGRIQILPSGNVYVNNTKTISDGQNSDIGTNIAMRVNVIFNKK